PPYVMPATPRATALVAESTKVALLFGDGLTFQYAPAAASVLAAKGYTVVRDGFPGTGLMSANLDWVARMQRDIATFHPRVVVIQPIGGYRVGGDPGYTTTGPSYAPHPFQNIAPDPGAFFAEWQRRAEELRAGARGGATPAHVGWVTTPPMQGPKTNTIAR